MTEVVALPPATSVLPDVRGEGRTLRVTPHLEQGVVVLSVWHEGVCAASFRLCADQVPDLVATLVGAGPAGTFRAC